MTAIQGPLEPQLQAVNAKTAARIIGAPESTLTGWCRRGILKSTKIGRTHFIRLADLEALLEQGAPNR